MKDGAYFMEMEMHVMDRPQSWDNHLIYAAMWCRGRHGVTSYFFLPWRINRGMQAVWLLVHQSPYTPHGDGVYELHEEASDWERRSTLAFDSISNLKQRVNPSIYPFLRFYLL
jgi:hypothetical protein